MRRMAITLILLAVCRSASSAEKPLSAISLETSGRLTVGSPYPDFELPRLGDRAAVRLSQFRGKKVLLIQFASW